MVRSALALAMAAVCAAPAAAQSARIDETATVGDIVVIARRSGAPSRYSSMMLRMLPSGSLNQAIFMPSPTWMSPFSSSPGMS